MSFGRRRCLLMKVMGWRSSLVRRMKIISRNCAKTTHIRVELLSWRSRPQPRRFPAASALCAAGHVLVGLVDPDTRIGVTVLVRRKPGSPPLPDLADWQATPPGRRRFLTPDKYANTYGASQEDIDAVTAFAGANGLAVSSTHTGRRSVHVEGNAAQLNAAFGITLNRYEGPRPASRVKLAGVPAAPATHAHHGYDGPVHLPADLIGVVLAVVGLDNRHLGDAGGSTGDPPNSNPLPVPTACGFYNFPNTGATDQTIGVIAPSDPVGTNKQRVSGYSSNDILNDYFPNLSNTNYHSTPTLNDVGLTVGTNTYSNGGTSGAFSAEISQDISTTATVAQGTTVNVYFTELSEQGLVVCLNRILLPETENGPTVVTCSFNFFNSDGSIGLSTTPGSTAAVVSALFQELAAVGINVCIISQDSGSDGGDADGNTHVVYPGSDPWVTCVGGTVIGSVNNGPPVTFEEWVWSNITSSPQVGGFGGASGGGASAAFPVPAYQSSAGITQITDSAGNTTKNQRCVPDVAAMVSYGGKTSTSKADNFYLNGSPYTFTGTSCACPLVAGLIAVVRSAFGISLGFLNPTLYQLGNSAINDITTGNNESKDASTPFYNAGNHWDACSGWGSIDGTKLLNSIAGLMFNQTFYFAVGKDNYGLDEVKEVGTYPQAFWLVLEGFTPTAVQLAAVPKLAGAFTGQSGVTVTLGAHR